MTVRVQAAAFDPGAQVNALHAANLGVGAVVSFVGYVRDFNDGRDVAGMFLEHYPGMTEKALSAIEAEALTRWPLKASLIIHRVGTLAPGAQIVLVATASESRHAAFEAASFLMDYLKTDAPFWKREDRSDGASHWLDARETDTASRDRWKKP